MKRQDNTFQLQDFFVQALQAHCEKASYGAQAEIARKTGLQPSYVNDILKSRKQGTEQTRRAIAHAIGMSYEEMILQGRQIVMGQKIQEHVKGAEKFPVFSKERATFIYQSAAKAMVIKNSFFFTDDNLVRMKPPGWLEFLDREITDMELYNMAMTEITKMAVRA